MNLTEHLQSLDRGAECLDRFAAKNFDVSVTSVLDRGVSEQHWPDPQPVKSVLSDVEELPLAIIPDPLQAWIKDVCYRMQCPLDIVAAAAIVMTGSVIGAGCAIRPKQKDNWQVIPNLWGGAIGRPSLLLKSPSIDQAMAPLSVLAREAKEKHDQEVEVFQVDLAAHKAKAGAFSDDMRKSARKTGSDVDFDNAKDSLKNLEEPQGPTWARYRTNDATIEKMAELLSENPRGLLLFRDELVGLLSSFDREGREQDRAFYLEAWNGYGEYTTDRIGRGTIYTENLCVSIFGGIQPAKLIGYLQGAVNGNENDGLLQRLQLLVYPDEPKQWKNIDQTPDYAAEDQYLSVVRKLAEMDFRDYGAVQDERDKFPYFRFTPEAQELFNEWLTELQTEKLFNEDSEIIMEHFGKYRSLFPSLALIFHLIDIANGGQSGNVSLVAAKKAAAWCDYLESHARRIYGLVVDMRIRTAEQLYKKIKAGKLENGFTVRDVYRNEWHLLKDTDAAQAACDELVEASVLRQQPTEYTRGRPSVRYLINPKVRAA